MLALKQIFSKSSKSPTNTYEWVHDPSASWCPYGFDGVANAISRSRRLDPAAYAANAANAVSEFDRNFYGTNDTDDSVTEVFGADIKSSSSCSLLASPNDNYSATTNSTQIFHPDTQALTVQASSHPAASYQREGIPGSEGICDKEPTDNFQDQPWQRTQETADSDIENIEAQVETNNTQGGWTLCPIQLKLSGDRPPVACQKKFPTERAAQRHAQKPHLLCPICYHEPPPPKKASRSLRENTLTIFTDRKAIMAHVGIHVPLLLCPNREFGCHKTFPRSTDLRKHIPKCMAEENRIYGKQIELIMAEMSSCRKVPLSKLNAHLELKLTYTNSSGEKKKLFDLQDNTNRLEMLGIDFPTGVNRVSTCVQQMRAVVGADEGSNLKEGYRDLFAGFTNQERQCMLEALLGLDTLDINPDTLSRKRSASTMVGNGDINSGVFVQSKAGPSSQYELGSKARSQPPTLHDILQDDMLLMGRPTKYHCNSMGMEEDLRGIIPEEESMCGYMVGVDWDSILA